MESHVGLFEATYEEAALEDRPLECHRQSPGGQLGPPRLATRDLRLATCGGTTRSRGGGYVDVSTVHTVEWTIFSCRALFLQVCLPSNKVGLGIAPAKVQTCT
jgi:hypothetical protein